MLIEHTKQVVRRFYTGHPTVKNGSWLRVT
jgi:hypothetical protein